MHTLCKLNQAAHIIVLLHLLKVLIAKQSFPSIELQIVLSIEKTHWIQNFFACIFWMLLGMFRYARDCLFEQIGEKGQAAKDFNAYDEAERQKSAQNQVC